MLNRFQLIAEALTSEPGTSEGVQTTDPFWSFAFLVGICAAGLCFLVIWFVWYGGLETLLTAPTRRNRLFPAAPLIMIVIWIALMSLISKGINTFFSDSTATQQELLSYASMASMELLMITAMLIIAHQTFARRLKGFGLNLRTIPKDAGFALVNLIAVYPLIMTGLWGVLWIGKWITGDPNFEIEAHQSLTLLDESQNLPIRILIVTFAVGIVPIFEEMLFRGFLQTTLRSFTNNSFIAILITSFLFVLLHPPQHWLALLALSFGLGYAYERSGSLFRPILMHIFFNGLSVALTLITV